MQNYDAFGVLQFFTYLESRYVNGYSMDVIEMN